jgi:hypothetical protein
MLSVAATEDNKVEKHHNQRNRTARKMEFMKLRRGAAIRQKI